MSKLIVVQIAVTFFRKLVTFFHHLTPLMASSEVYTLNSGALIVIELCFLDLLISPDRIIFEMKSFCETPLIIYDRPNMSILAFEFIFESILDWKCLE